MIAAPRTLCYFRSADSIGAHLNPVSRNLGLWLLLVLMGRAGHPPVERDLEPAGPLRQVLGVVSLIIFILSFVPVPFEQITVPS